ncbi:MAG: hypothetical protein E2O52_06035 [Gammaproteobacteria bacterium]|nr:MAG: hypothetical protein E2O52_06035 [Gammaproteobacteria bacterium]
MVVVFGLLAAGPIPQDMAYHRFADTRALFGVANFGDVASNIGFVVVGIVGWVVVVGRRRRDIFSDPADARPYLAFFFGVTLVSLGSAWYHWSPSNESLLWDRLPMSIAFMALCSAIVADRINTRAGTTWLLALLIVLGLSSLGYWYWTESLGCGDLRFYAFVQFFPMLALPVVCWLFPARRYTPVRYLGWVLIWYVLSKVLEFFDGQVLALLGNTVSGHSLKHLAAAVAPLVVVRMLLAAR